METSVVIKASKNGKQFYAVRKGRQIGIFSTWNEIEPLIKGYSGSQYKKFLLFADAVNYIKEAIGNETYEELTKKSPSITVPVPVPSLPPPPLPPPAPLGKNKKERATRNKRDDESENKNDEEELKELKELTELESMIMEYFLAYEHKRSLTYVYTDGGVKGNGKKHAFGTCGVFFSDLDIVPLSFKLTGDKITNNVAELTAIKAGLESTMHIKHKIIIFTDSQYSRDSLTKYYPAWMKNGWKLRTGEPVKNADLIKEIISLIRPNVQFEWIRAHTEKDDLHTIGNRIANYLADGPP